MGREWDLLLLNARLMTIDRAAHMSWVEFPELVFFKWPVATISATCEEPRIVATSSAPVTIIGFLSDCHFPAPFPELWPESRSEANPKPGPSGFIWHSAHRSMTGNEAGIAYMSKYCVAQMNELKVLEKIAGISGATET